VEIGTINFSLIIIFDMVLAPCKLM